MTDQTNDLTPALTEKNWDRQEMHPFFIRNGELWQWTGDGAYRIEQLDGLMALANHALPDDSPYKITRADVEVVLTAAKEPMTEVIALRALAAKLAALLPEE